MKQFIKIGNLFLNRNDIISVNGDHTREHQVWETGENGLSYITTHYVLVVTRGLKYIYIGEGAAASESVEYIFEHGTPQASAILAWLEWQSEDLLRKAPKDESVL